MSGRLGILRNVPVVVQIPEEEEEHDDPNKYPADYEEDPIDLIPDSHFPILRGQNFVSG